METIIALLFVLLPVIFKLIGKKFEQSGQSEVAERMRKIAQTLGEDGDDDLMKWLGGKNESEAEHDDDGQVVNVPPVQPAPVQPYVSPVAPAPAVSENVVRQTKSKSKPASKKKPILVEDVSDKKAEKIDPKKLVIYSEIMKPKFTE